MLSNKIIKKNYHWKNRIISEYDFYTLYFSFLVFFIFLAWESISLSFFAELNSRTSIFLLLEFMNLAMAWRVFILGTRARLFQNLPTNRESLGRGISAAASWIGLSAVSPSESSAWIVMISCGQNFCWFERVSAFCWSFRRRSVSGSGAGEFPWSSLLEEVLDEVVVELDEEVVSMRGCQKSVILNLKKGSRLGWSI